MKKQSLLTVLLILIINSVQSQSIIHDLLSSNPEYSDTIFMIDKSFKKCDSTWRTNPEWSDCLLTHINMWNEYMKETYDSLINELDSTGQSILKKSQKSWEENNEYEDKLSNYIMNAGLYFGREDDFKKFYSDLYEVRERALELRSCLYVIRIINEEKNKK